MTAKAASPRIFDTRAISFWRGVGSSSVLSSMPAMRPIWVPMPVEVTTIRPVPWVTAVPLRTMLVLSPKATVRSSRVGRLPTGRDSPATRRTKVWGGGREIRPRQPRGVTTPPPRPPGIWPWQPEEGRPADP